MIWAVLLLQDTETLQTYEAFARESAYEEEGEHPPTLTTPTTGTNSRNLGSLARGEPNDRATTSPGPPQKPLAWRWTRTTKAKAHP